MPLETLAPIAASIDDAFAEELGAGAAAPEKAAPRPKKHRRGR